MNKRRVRGRDKYLVRWKGCMAEEDTWESRENLKNAGELVEEFEKEYGREEEEETRRQERGRREHVQQGIAREVHGKIIVRMGGEEIQA